MNIEQAQRLGWLDDAGRIVGGDVVAPIQPKRRESDIEPSAWRAHTRVSLSRDERNIEPDPDVEEPAPEAPKIPADTLRRLRAPVIERVDAQGRRTFIHDRQVKDDGLITGSR